jgi:hypothetical protein
VALAAGQVEHHLAAEVAQQLEHAGVDDVLVPELLLLAEEGGELLGGPLPAGDRFFVADIS